MTVPKCENMALVTTTFYKNTDETRYKLACGMVKKAVDAGYKVLIVDGSPNPTVTETLKGLGATVFPELHKGMGASRRQVFFHAVEELRKVDTKDEKIIVWLEPEKIDLVSSVQDIVRPILERRTTITIPQRTDGQICLNCSSLKSRL